MDISELIHESEGQQVQKIDEFLRTRPYFLLENLSQQCEELFIETNQRLSILIGSSYPQILRTARSATVLHEQCSDFMNNLNTIKKTHRSLQKTLFSQPIAPLNVYENKNNNTKVLLPLILPLSPLFQKSVKSKIYNWISELNSGVGETASTCQQSLLRIFFSLPQTILETLKVGDVLEVCYIFLGLSPCIYNHLISAITRNTQENKVLTDGTEYNLVDTDEEKHLDTNQLIPEQFELIKRQVDYFHCYDTLDRLEQASLELLSEEEILLPIESSDKCCSICEKLVLNSPVLVGQLLKALAVLHLLRVVTSESKLIHFFLNEREKLLKQITTTVTMDKVVPYVEAGSEQSCKVIEACFASQEQNGKNCVVDRLETGFKNKIILLSNKIVTVLYIIQATLLIGELFLANYGYRTTKTENNVDNKSSFHVASQLKFGSKFQYSIEETRKQKEKVRIGNKDVCSDSDQNTQDLADVTTRMTLLRSLSEEDFSLGKSESQTTKRGFTQTEQTRTNPCGHGLFDNMIYLLFKQFSFNTKTNETCDCRICTKQRPLNLLHIYSDGVRFPQWVAQNKYENHHEQQEQRSCELCFQEGGNDNKQEDSVFSNIENHLWKSYLVPVVNELFEEVKRVSVAPANLACCDVIWKLICARFLYLRLYTLKSLNMPGLSTEELNCTETTQRLSDLLQLDSINFELERVEKIFHSNFCEYVSTINKSSQEKNNTEAYSVCHGLRFFEQLAKLFDEHFNTLLYRSLDFTFKTCLDSWFTFDGSSLNENDFLLNRFKSLSKTIDTCVIQLLKESNSSFRMISSTRVHHFQINRTIALAFCETLKSIVESKCEQYRKLNKIDSNKCAELLSLGLAVEAFYAVVNHCSVKKLFTQECIAVDEPMASLIKLLTSIETGGDAQQTVKLCLKTFSGASKFFLSSWISQVLREHILLFQKSLIKFFKALDDMDPMIAPAFVCSTYLWTFLKKDDSSLLMPTQPSVFLVDILFKASNEISQAKHMQRSFLAVLYKIHPQVYFSVIEAFQLIIINSISVVVTKTYERLLLLSNSVTSHAERHCAFQALFDLETLNRLSSELTFDKDVFKLSSFDNEDDNNKISFSSINEFIEVIKKKCLTSIIDQMLYDSFFNISVENYVKTQMLCLMPLMERSQQHSNILRDIWKLRQKKSPEEFSPIQALPLPFNVIQPFKLP